MHMKGSWHRSGQAAMALVLTLSLGACAGGGNGGSPSGSDSASGSASGSSEPGKLEKVRVSLWDRSNSPNGQKLTDTVIVKKLQEEARKEGLDVEYVVLPRSQESEKNSVWMASGSGPDIIITYDMNAMFKWAEQGGLWELDDLLDQYGPDIKSLIGPALDVAGTYKGKRYAIPAMRMSTAAASNMKIRQDWLDKLGLKAPTTLDELYETLKAFKEQDPGGVGKDNVVPWALPAISQGMKGFFFGPMWGAGVATDGPATEMYMPSGNFENGEFHSAVALEEGKEFFRFMNKLYKEGLISKEFVTDVNSQQFIQNYTSGVSGFMESNEDPWVVTKETRKSVPDATWVTLDPLVRPNGTQAMTMANVYGLLSLVPKSSPNPAAAIKYLNFLAKNITLVQGGIEGVHYKEEDGLFVAIDPAKNAEEIDWYFKDLNLLTQGYMGNPTKEQIKELYANESNPDEIADILDPYYRSFENYGKQGPLIDTPRPVSDKSVANITQFLYDALSKAVIAKDFDAEWENVVTGWKKNGGEEYDAEVTQSLVAMNWKTTNE
ncbi:extracellular solute-binding protein [Cohnella fermenti]|uniref:Extracellular solute-binding protein n=2 Tax=Cohnella fermenti TaxID=2565925 RepID=A0A4V3WFY0_9BACL|nr:extracellular solute-binding protein [Cohnella fermenti]